MIHGDDTLAPNSFEVSGTREMVKKRPMIQAISPDIWKRKS